MLRQSVFIPTLILAGVWSQANANQPCESLTSLKLPNTTITLAQTVAAGAFIPPKPIFRPPGAPAPDFKGLPAFCRVAATVKPTKDSDIRMEVWMPAEGWDGRFRGEGNGGFAGAIGYAEMGQALRQGNATASTDTGHSAGVTDASWALGHPEKVTDFGYRGIHEMTRVAKAATKAFYGSGPRYSYFGSCSNGGRQALMEAQRFPQDYDGILAGAPANFWTHLLANGLADTQAITLDQASYLPSSKLPVIARAVNSACDASDGVSDGIVNDPSKCDFDPTTLLCKEGDSENCLTAPQVAALKKLYAGTRDAKGQEIFPGFLPGAEEGQNGWGPWITGPAPGKSLIFAFSNGFFSNVVYEQAEWNYKDADIDKAVRAADEKTANILNATDPNLTAFKARGGKLVLYHGWNDPAISALNTINYYNSVAKKMGRQEIDTFLRLYLEPGMQHCGGGPGPDSFGQNGTDEKDPRRNVELVLAQWVEKGIAPSAIIATKYMDGDSAKGVKMTRPLCPYPQFAKYNGSGSSDDAANFVCKTP